MKRIKGKVKFYYDFDGDVLYAYINKSRLAYCIEEDNGILIRVDPKSNKVVGFTIVDFKRRLFGGIFPHKILYFEEINGLTV